MASNFIKTAAVQTLAVATVEETGFKRSAAYGDSSSAYINGTKPIDIKAALEIVTSEYNISSNPNDYIFEAIRGNTANIANDNNDGFHKNELLRFDHRLGKQVYRTYELKPHHIQHAASNPKTARGFILDAHYNDSAQAMDDCPECGHKTADKGNRDPETGIHCANCGTVVKDEFVELLVAIDTKKDPTFAQGVLNGVLKHGSMGCSCLRTRCNVCNNVAYSRSEFCAHIRNKGKEYDESERGFNPIAFIIKHKGKTAEKLKKIAKAFEWCEGTIFDEYSRVHDPADPKAEQYEILKLSEKVASIEKDDKLRNESEILLLQTKIAELEKKVDEKFNMAKQAQAMPPMPPEAPAAPPPSPSPGPISMEEGKDGKVVININTKGGPDVDLASSEPVEGIEPPGIPIENMTPEDVGATPAPAGSTLTPEAMGIIPKAGPKGASKNTGGPSMLRFAQSYKNLKAEITSVGNVRIFDDGGTYFVVKPDRVSADGKVASKTGMELAKAVLTMVAEHGIGGTIKRTNAIVGPRIAQVLEYAVDDMKDLEREKTDSILEQTDDDMTEDRDGNKKKLETATGTGEATDTKSPHETKTIDDSVLPERETDVEDEQNNVDDPKSLLKGDGGVTKNQDADTREKREKFDLGKSSIDTVTPDHQDPVSGKKASNPKYAAQQHAARLEALYKNRFEAKSAELIKKYADLEKNLTDRMLKAMKISARRQALNLEYSPMKTAIGIALCNPRPLGNGYDYNPMDQQTAVRIIEASFNEPMIEGTDKPAWEAFIDGLFDRAASIMKMNDETLMQIEDDLRNIKTASVPLDDVVVMDPHVDHALKLAMKQGNLQLAPTAKETTPVLGTDKRSSIRHAVGVTRVASLANASR